MYIHAASQYRKMQALAFEMLKVATIHSCHELEHFPFLPFVMPCLIGRLSDRAPSTDSVKCSSTGKYDQCMFYTGTTCKVKETFMFV